MLPRVDPTNNTLVDERYVTVALGCDYRDVPPNRGVYKGAARETIAVEVGTLPLAALPGIRFRDTTLEEAAKYALISLDSTTRSNVSVGPPIDLLLYGADSLSLTQHRRFAEHDPDLAKIRTHWERTLRQGVHDLPAIEFPPPSAMARAAPAALPRSTV